MKNKIIILSQICILFLLLLSCQDVKPKVKKKAMNNTKIVMNPISKFSGNFSGIHNQKEIFITLIPETTSKRVSGVLILDGKKAKISVVEKKEICTGTIIEDDTKKQYSIVMKFAGKNLNCAITFPEFNNHILSFDLSKSTLTFNGNEDSISIENGNTITSGNSSDNYSNQKRNPDVIGKWRFTEVLSSGSGEFYASFSTDYFIKINADGTAVTWTGRSAGGTNTVIIEGGYGTNVTQYEWYTNDKEFYFVNPQTRQEEVVSYYAERYRIMFSSGNNKRVFERIN